MAYDVVVCGGGPAGVAAAVSAARQGVKTLLIERYGFLGGMATAALVGPWMSFHTASGKLVVGGIAQEIVDELYALGGSNGHVREIPYGHVFSITQFDHEALKLVLLSMAQKAGVHLLLHTTVTDASRSESAITSLRVSSKSGMSDIQARVFVDATGDGDLCASAGCEFELGRTADGYPQPMSHLFHVAGVDMEEVRSHILEHPDQFVIAEDPYVGKITPDEIRSLEINAVCGFFDIVRKALNEGRIPPYRDRVLFFANMVPGEVTINMARVVKKVGTRADHLTQAEIEGRTQIHQIVEFLRSDVPGFASCWLTRSPATVGVRETRRITGDYTLEIKDIVEGKSFSDVIGLGSYPVDIHDPAGKKITHIQVKDGGSYGIPLRALLPRGTENLVVSGRPISATHEAHASTRVQLTCMVTGQAAGTVAGLAARAASLPREVGIGDVQRTLEKQGAVLGEPG